MSDLLARIQDDHRPPPELTARCLRQLDDWFAKLEEGGTVNVSPLVSGDHDTLVTAHAWMATCIYLMAMCEPISSELRELSYALDRSAQQPSLF